MSLVHIQYCLQNIVDNNNSNSDFLSNINLSNTSPHAIIYPKIIPNFILVTTNFWKKIKKQVLIKQINITEIEPNSTNINILRPLYISSISLIKAFKPNLTNFILPNLLSLQFLYNILPENANCKVITNYINAILLQNTL